MHIMRSFTRMGRALAAGAAAAGLTVSAAPAQQAPPSSSQPSQQRPAAPVQRQPQKPAPAQPAQPAPSQGIQNWFPMPQGVEPVRPARPAALTPERVRPPAEAMIDCKDAPKTAVTQVPEPLSRWATIYCLKGGHVFSYNDRHLARFPRTTALGSFGAAELTGRTGELGHKAHFTKIAYGPLPNAEKQSLLSGADPTAVNFLKDKPLFKIELTVDTGQTFTMVAAEPDKDPFWIVTVVNGKPARSFFVASLDYLNKRR
jgi:hypothetical protein